MIRHRRATVAAIVLATSAVSVRAADLIWLGGTGAISDANYVNTTTHAVVAPAATPTTDYSYIGEDGTATLTSGSVTIPRLRVGHSFTTGAVDGADAGPGTVIVSGGTLALASGTTSATGITPGTDGALIVGYNNTGNFTITAGTVTVNRFVSVGHDNTDPTDVITNAPGSTASFNISGTGTLALTGTSNSNVLVGNGVPGYFTISDGGTFTTKTAGLQVGIGSTGTFTQTGGTTSLSASTIIGQSTSANSSMSVTAGTYASTSMNVGNDTATDTSVLLGGTAQVTFTGAINVGSGAGARSSLTINGDAVLGSAGIAVGTATGATDSSITIGGNAKITGSAGFNIGTGATGTTNSSATITDNAVVNLNNGFTVGLTNDSNAVLNVGGNATINLAVAGSTTNHLFVGRGTSNTTLNMTGGAISTPNLALFGTAATGAIITVNQSAGTITAGTSAVAGNLNRGFKIGDTGGVNTYNLSGTGGINVAAGVLIVGRQNSNATLNQTGGTVVANGGLNVGEAETATATLQTGTGTYNISAGSLTTNVTAVVLTTYYSATNALSIANAGTGTFRVIGDDATISVTGNMLVDALPAVDPTPARVGTLAYRLEAGDASLSTINVAPIEAVAGTGIATFAAGAVLQLDFNSIKPVQGIYTAINAAGIVNNGLTPSIPGGWNYQVIAGGNGKLLQFFAGDLNADGLLNADDYAAMDRGAAKHLSGGANGDLNGDGTIDSDDYKLIDAAFITLHPGGLNPGFLAMREGQFGADYVAGLLASVPEPSSLAGLAIAGLALAKRRRRAR